MKMTDIRQSAYGGFCAGLLAGLGVAMVDSVRLWAIGGLDWTLPWYASLLYGPLLGILGLVGGGILSWISASIGRWPLTRRMNNVALGFLLFSMFSLAILFFYLYRDVFGEKLSVFSPKMLGVLAGCGMALLVINVAGALLFRYLLNGRLSRWVRIGTAETLYGGLTLLLLGLSAIVGGRATGGELGPLPTQKRPNIILIQSDTHRADHSGVYGGSADLTPNLDQFAKDGVVFENGFSPSSWTRPASISLLTGRYPSSHTAIHKGSILPDSVTTLGDVLLEGGYETIGISTNYNLTPFFNADKGFSDFRYLPPNLPLFATDEQAKLIFIEVFKKVAARFRSNRDVPDDYYVIGEVVTDKALERLDQRDTRRPFFMFLVYMDVHDPFFRHPFDGHAISHRANPNPDINDTAFIEEMKELYRGEVKYWDAQFGRFLDGLRERGLYEDTMIVVVSDHGEEFGEHGGFWHGTTLYDEQLKVLFVVKYGADSLLAQSAGQRVDTWVSLVDVAPMIIDQAGLEIPAEMQGKKQRLNDRDEMFAETDHQGNIVTSVLYATPDGDWLKVISANEGNPRGLKPVELYDMRTDPLEMSDMSAQTELVEPALEKLREAEKRAMEGRAEAVMGELTSEMKSQLEALGYMD